MTAADLITDLAPQAHGGTAAALRPGGEGDGPPLNLAPRRGPRRLTRRQLADAAHDARGLADYYRDLAREDDEAGDRDAAASWAALADEADADADRHERQLDQRRADCESHARRRDRVAAAHPADLQPAREGQQTP